MSQWPAVALVNATPRVLASLSREKLAAVARLWRKRWGWSPSKCSQMLQMVATARRARREASRLEPPLKIAQRVLRRDGLGTTEPEVIAMLRAFCTPDPPTEAEALEACIDRWQDVLAAPE